MNRPQKISDEQLLEYIDGTLNAEQNRRIEEALQDKTVAARLKELKQIDQLLSSVQQEQPRQNFTAYVMANLDKPIVTRSVYSKKNGLFLIILALLTVVAGSLYMTESFVNFDISNSLNVDQLNAPFEIPDVEVSGAINLKMVTDGLLFSIVILALLLLDRVVLKPFFRNRRPEVQY